jgi:hypothetical protein
MMFNNPIFNEEAKLKLAEREHEAETYRWQKQLGYGDGGNLKWIFGLITLIALLILVVLVL